MAGVRLTFQDDDLGVTGDVDRFEEAIAQLRRKVAVSDDTWDELQAEERPRAFRVATVAYADIAQDVLDELVRAVENGDSYADFEQRVLEMLDDRWAGAEAPSLQNVFRTNVMSAYNAGRRELYQQPEVREARPYLRWEFIDDDRLCPICEECAGTILAGDDPFWDENWPPLHFSDRCTVSALTEEEAQAEGISDEAPDPGTLDGFGSATSDEDWEPDLSTYDPEIAGVLRGQLEDDES